MRKLFGLSKQPKYDTNIGKKRFDISKQMGKGFTLSGNEFDKHLEVIIIRLAETPQAVDALYFVIDKILKNPRDSKNKQVNITKPVFFRTIGRSGDWGIRFLEALGFIKSQNKQYYVLHKRYEDLNKVSIGFNKLKKAQESETYLLAQDKISFAKETAKLLSDGSEEENISKLKFMEKVPAEPKKGAGGNTSVRVYFGDADISRYFASDNTLQSVLNWVSASLHSSLIDKLQQQKFELIDRTVYPPKVIIINTKQQQQSNRKSDASSELDILGMLDNLNVEKPSEEKTLQSLGIWPSGEIEIQKFGFHSRERALNGIIEKQ